MSDQRAKPEDEYRSGCPCCQRTEDVEAERDRLVAAIRRHREAINGLHEVLAPEAKFDAMDRALWAVLGGENET